MEKISRDWIINQEETGICLKEHRQGQTNDMAKAEQWDACNNLVIAWLMNVVLIKSLDLYYMYNLHKEVWIQLEKRFCLSNGSRKNSLNKKVYSMKQDRT